MGKAKGKIADVKKQSNSTFIVYLADKYNKLMVRLRIFTAQTRFKNMRLSKIFIYVFTAAAAIAACVLMVTLKQPYGLIAFPLAGLSAIVFRYVKINPVKWTLTILALSASIFCIVSGMLFFMDNIQRKGKFDLDTAVHFEKDTFQNSLLKAKRENKVVFVDFYTIWCGPCLQFSRTVLMDEQVGEIMNQAFVNVKLDAETGEGIDLSKKYLVKAYPTLLIVDTEGRLLEEVNEHYLPDEEKMKATARKYIAVKKPVKQ